MSEDNKEFARALTARLTESFNIRAWDESDTRNNGRLLCMFDYEMAAWSGGREAVAQKAEEWLQEIGHEFEENAKPNTSKEARNDTREIAGAVISFCRGPQGLH